MARVRLAERELLGKRRPPPHGEIISDAPLLGHAQRRAGLQVKGSSQRIGGLVGQMPLDQLHRFDHRRREVHEVEAASHRARPGEQASIHRDTIRVGRRSANEDTGDVRLGIEQTGHSGHADCEFARAHVGQVAKRVHRDDVFHVGCVAFKGERRSVALPLASDLKLRHLIGRGRKIEIPDSAFAVGDRHVGARGVEAEISDDHAMHAGRHAGKHKSSRRISERS